MPKEPEELEPWLAEALGIPQRPEERDEQGRFRRGCKPGPGRPKGALDFGAVARAACERSGTTLQEAAERLWQTLFDVATTRGDVAAMRMLFDRIFGRVPKEVRLELEDKPRGPEFPKDFDAEAYLVKLGELARGNYGPDSRAKPPAKA